MALKHLARLFSGHNAYAWNSNS